MWTFRTILWAALALLMPVLAFAQVDPTTTATTTEAIIGLIGQAGKAIGSGEWALLIGLVLAGLIIAARRWPYAEKWIQKLPSPWRPWLLGLIPALVTLSIALQTGPGVKKTILSTLIAWLTAVGGAALDPKKIE